MFNNLPEVLLHRGGIKSNGLPLLGQDPFALGRKDTCRRQHKRSVKNHQGYEFFKRDQYQDEWNQSVCGVSHGPSLTKGSNGLADIGTVCLDEPGLPSGKGVPAGLDPGEYLVYLFPVGVDELQTPEIKFLGEY